LRIISGTAKGRKLVGFSGKNIRPTSDRVREAVFSSLFSQLGSFTDKSVLDLFAGTGAMAIEALSRGAQKAVLVDQGRQSEELIGKNLATTGLAERADFRRGRVNALLPNLAASGPFDLIFIDPPYADPEIAALLQDVYRFGLLQSDGIMCVETSEKVELPAEIGDLARFERRRYGATAISYFRIQGSGADLP